MEIPTTELREITRSWDRATWNDYLDWFETGRREALVHPLQYEIIGNTETRTIFEIFAQDSSEENRALCEELLGLLSPLEAEVLRKIYLEGRTLAEIGFSLSRAVPVIWRIKNKALFRLRRGPHGDKGYARRTMKGESFSSAPDSSNLWDRLLDERIKEARTYDPKYRKREFNRLKGTSLGAALYELPDDIQELIYRHYWCGQSASLLAKDLGLGVNTVQDTIRAGITKAKRQAIEIEGGTL